MIEVIKQNSWSKEGISTLVPIVHLLIIKNLIAVNCFTLAGFISTNAETMLYSALK
jgi:hypothetical protein